MQQLGTLEAALATASKIVTPELILNHIKVLAADEFEGRCPGALGEDKTIEYFNAQFAAISAATGATFKIEEQSVPAVEISSQTELRFTVGGAQLDLEAPKDFIAGSRCLKPSIKIENASLVFCGYGIVAPEYGWDDFKGTDVSGKVLVVLCGDPILPHPTEPGKVDDSMFRGNELTYYGRWSCKYEVGANKGAAAVMIIHETDRAGYGWDVVTHSFGQSGFELNSGEVERPPVDGWFSFEAATRLLAEAGLDLQTLKQAAMRKDFSPVSLPVNANINVDCTFKELESKNFIATLEGSDPKLRHEHVVYCAHWDHFGLAPGGIVSGAVDNASGCAGVLALANAFASLNPRPPRSVVFFLPTLEEQGLIGTRYYVMSQKENLRDMLAVLNFEMLNVWGLGPNFSSVCRGHSTLDKLLDDAGAKQKRNVVPDPQPEKGYLYRSDHFPFMQAGVPGLAIFFPCSDFMEQRQSYIQNDYHKVTDKVRPDWDLAGAAADTILMFDVGLQLLHFGQRATWNKMSEFNRAY